jgi:uncharacterized protein YggE
MVALVVTVSVPWISLHGQIPEDESRITVTGDAEVRVVPDEVILTLGVETNDMDLTAAKAENDARMARVIAAAEGLGVRTNLIQTDFVGIEPRYTYERAQRHFLGYWVRKNTAITLGDIDTFETLLSRVLEAGANYVHGIQFRTTALRNHRDRARSIALRAARDKAHLMASELGREVGSPFLIREDHSGWWSWYSGWWGNRGGGALSQNVVQNAPTTPGATDGATAPGQISVTARVTVTFNLK